VRDSNKNGRFIKVHQLYYMIIMAEANIKPTSNSTNNSGKNNPPPPKPDTSPKPPPPPNQTPPPVTGAPIPNHPKAIPTLIIGISACGCFLLTWLFGSLGFGLCCPPIGVVCGIVALVLGLKVRKEIKKDPSKYGGDGQALGGMICGGIALGLCALQIILGIVMAILFTAYFIAIIAIPLGIIGCNSGIFTIGIGLGMVLAICSIVKMSRTKDLTKASRGK
jgi:hypothetical protein